MSQFSMVMLLSCLFCPPHHLAGIAGGNAVGRNAMGDDGTSADDRTGPDGDPFQDDDLCANPHVVPDDDGGGGRWFGMGPAALPRDGVRVGVGDEHAATDVDVIADGDTLLHPDACGAHARMVADGEGAFRLHVECPAHVAADGVHTMTRGEIEVIANGHSTPPS